MSVRKNKLYEFFMSRHREEFLAEISTATDAERACETFPNDRILDYLELLNSNIAISLLVSYGMDFVDAIARDIDAKKFKLTPAQLRKLIKKAKEQN